MDQFHIITLKRRSTSNLQGAVTYRSVTIEEELKAFIQCPKCEEYGHNTKGYCKLSDVYALYVASLIVGLNVPLTKSLVILKNVDSESIVRVIIPLNTKDFLIIHISMITYHPSTDQSKSFLKLKKM